LTWFFSLCNGRQATPIGYRATPSAGIRIAAHFLYIFRREFSWTQKMLHFQSILFATDLSQSSQNAYALACSLARDHGANLIVLYVVPTGTHEIISLAQLGHSSSEEQFDHDVDHHVHGVHPTIDGVSTRYLIAHGAASDVIVRTAHETHCDLIVVGSHGRTRLARMLMGSVAEQVFRTAPCPVLVVRGHSGIEAAAVAEVHLATS
jgi:nucleotide-binding universal stress UspA family protein